MNRDKTASEKPAQMSGSNPAVNPGDDGTPGTPGTGENVCPDCKGRGRLGAAPCKTCGGTGKVIEGIGGG
jgi:DnaJ-class molecular chaperone